MKLVHDRDLAALDSALARPGEARAGLLAAFRHGVRPLPTRGSSFFVHLSELCPVACRHCMYASTMTPKSMQSALTDVDVGLVGAFVSESRSEKLNITGGGEPFLRFPAILELVATVRVPRIEIVTAGYWARSQRRAAELIRRIDLARAANRAGPEVLLRLSLDRYHLEAPRPVRYEQYVNAVRAWQSLRTGMAFGLRSIQPDRDLVDIELARRLGARIEVLDDWNRRIVLPSGERIPITFNVFRISGAAADLARDETVRLRTGSMDIAEYYSPFQTTEHRLSLATAVNDAIRGSYTPTDGLAVTLDSDLTFWIFTGTSPDRRLRLTGQSFAEAVEYFFGDPVTHLLVEDGVWALADLVERLRPDVARAALAKNDVASLVEDLLGDESVRLAVTVVALRRLHRAGRGGIDEAHPLHPLVAGTPEPELLDRLRERCGR